MTREGRCHVVSFGCRVNQADGEAVLDELRARGMTATGSTADADLVVLQSCTVTHRSDADLRKAIHRIQRENPAARVVVAGCAAQRDPSALVGLGGLRAVVGHERPEVVAEVAAATLTAAPDAAPRVLRTELEALGPEELPPVRPVARASDRTRPFVKIQDGCDAHCTYCIIPSVRGPARSARRAEVVAAVDGLIADGAFEIVLAGVHLGTYASDGAGLTELVAELLERPGLGRLRLSCIEPMAFPLGLATLAARDRRLAPHFHLPLQAGSDRILKRMGRPYRGAEYVEALRAVREAVPTACLGTDVIVGFPGETRADFEATLAVLEAASIDHVHAFSYSDREGTASTRLGGKVGPRTIKERNAELRAWSDARFAAHLDRHVGREVGAVSLGEPGQPAREALTETFCPVDLVEPVEPNRGLTLAITSRTGSRLVGRVAGAPATPSVGSGALDRRA